MVVTTAFGEGPLTGRQIAKVGVTIIRSSTTGAEQTRQGEVLAPGRPRPYRRTRPAATTRIGALCVTRLPCPFTTPIRDGGSPSSKSAGPLVPWLFANPPSSGQKAAWPLVSWPQDRLTCYFLVLLRAGLTGTPKARSRGDGKTSIVRWCNWRSGG